MKFWIAAIALLFAAPALAQPQDISAPGTVPHAAARAGFPEQVGEFHRSHVLRYAENDLSANYNLRRGDDFLRLSVYIYPAPHVPEAQRAAACRDEMAVIDGQIRQAYKDAERLENGEAAALPGTAAGLRLRSLHRLQFALRSAEPENVRRDTRLYCYVGGDWFVKYYSSSNAGFDVAAAIDAFIAAGPWPGRGAGSVAMPAAQQHHQGDVLRQSAQWRRRDSRLQTRPRDENAIAYCSSTMAAQNVAHSASVDNLNVVADTAEKQGVHVLAVAGQHGSAQALEMVAGDYAAVDYW